MQILPGVVGQQCQLVTDNQKSNSVLKAYNKTDKLRSILPEKNQQSPYL